MGLLNDYVIEQAEKWNKVPSEWLTDVLDKIDSCTLATHVGKVYASRFQDKYI